MERNNKKSSELKEMKDFGLYPFVSWEYQFIESYKQAILNCFTKSYYSEPMQNSWIGWQLSSEWFPSHSKYQKSPQGSVKDVTKKEIKANKDYANTSIGNSTNSSSNPSSVNDENVNIRNNEDSLRIFKYRNTLCHSPLSFSSPQNKLLRLKFWPLSFSFRI